MSTAQPPANAWARERERGSRLALRMMAFIAVAFGRRIARWVLHPIALYFVVFARDSRRHSERYLARALGRAVRWRDRYQHVLTFAATVLDRVYFARGHLHEFELHVDGVPLMDELVAGGRGALLLGAHFGSFEALHAVGAGRPGLRVAMAMFPDNARMIHDTLRSIAPHFHLDIITIGRSDSTLAVRDWLDGGGLVGVLGDRVLGAVGARSSLVELPFLGAPARFSDAPLRLAALLRRRVIFMAALYRGGRRYDVRFEALADFTQGSADATQRDNRLRDALQAYVQRLEALCREAPYNWFNFFDFWNEDVRR
ncbi:MAG TPA: acyl-CoA synthetase [Burkholderiaceae bacterium]|nr:acyl-CoA synthetase [Burkholderiaceae bacterium]